MHHFLGRSIRTSALLLVFGVACVALVADDAAASVDVPMSVVTAPQEFDRALCPLADLGPIATHALAAECPGPLCRTIGPAPWLPDGRMIAVNADRDAGRTGEEEEGKIPLRDRMDLAIAQEIRMTLDPALGKVPRERLIAAQQMADQLRQEGRAAIPGVTWQERGPRNVSGRSRAVLVDPNTASGLKVFAAGVGGGLWMTTDISAAEPTWTSVNDFFDNLAITALVADPSNPQVMYFGTGEGFFNLDAIQGNGIWKTTNGGTSWTQLASTDIANFNFVQKMAVNATGVVFAATATGLRRSADGGTTWTKVLGTGIGITGAVSNFAYDVEIAANGDVYASIDTSIHKSTNAGVTFGAAQTVPIAMGRVELACAPNDANYVYALVESGNSVNGILRTVNGGTTWVLRTEPDDADPGIPNTDFSRSQAWYDLTIAVDPGNRDRLMVGGVDLFLSTDGAGTWSQISHWYGGFGEQYVHADQHQILYQPGSSTVAYFANDGGIYRTTDANASNPTIAFRGTNLNITQFYAAAIHPTAATNYYLAGAQDNGSHQFNSAGIDDTVEVTGGDGAFTHIDQDQPQFQFTAYVYNDFYRSINGGGSWTNVTTGGGQFISPTDYDNLNNRLYGNSGSNNYLRWDNPQSGNTFAVVAVAGFGGFVTAATVSPNTANRVFFGISNGDVFRVDNAHTAGPTATNISTGLPAGNPNNIEVETGNDNHLLVVYTNYGINSVWESVNAGVSWTSVEGNLPDMPIRWALFNPNNDDQALLATEVGVWSTDNLNGGATVWQPSNTGLANVRTDMLQIRSSDKQIIAATHGRGLYSSNFLAPVALSYDSSSVTSGNNRLDPNECNTLNVTLGNTGGGIASSLNGTLSTSTPGVTIAQAASAYPNLAGGGTVTNNTAFQISTGPGLACGSTVNLSMAATYSGGSATLPFTMSVGTPVIAFSQNFDGVVAPALPASWTTARTGTTPPAFFATAVTGADTAPNVAFTNGSGTTATNALLSPTIALPAGTHNAILTFRHAWNFESSGGSNWDGAVLELSTNGGSTWNDVTSGAVGGSFTAGGYNGTLHSTNPLGARGGWTSTQSVFTTSTLSLPPALNGLNASFRFRAAWDSSTANADPNWRIDTLSLQAGFSCTSGVGVCSGAATQLAIGTQPSNTVAGVAISPAVTVRILDAGGVLTSSNANVTLAIGTNPGGGTLSGTTTVAAVNGTATFGNLSINSIGTGYTLAATSGGLSGTTSSSFNIDAQATTTAITSDLPDASVVGQPYTVIVNVAGLSSSPTGTVTVRDGAAGSPSCGPATLVAAVAPNSTASCALTSTSAGPKTLTADYAPASGAFTASSGTTTHQVNPAATSISVVGPVRSRINQPTTFTFALSVDAPGAGVPAGTVTLSSGASSCLVTVPTATPSCDLSFPALGTRTINAAFAPSDGNFVAATSSGAGNAQTLVFALSDIAVTKSDGTTAYPANGTIVYVLSVRNLGPDAAVNLRVRDTAPAELASVVWSCTASAGVTCPQLSGSGDLDALIASFPVGGQLDYSFSGNVVGSPAQIANTLLVDLPIDTTVEDPVLGNNTATDADVLDGLFQDGFESAGPVAPTGSWSVASAKLRATSDVVPEVAPVAEPVHGEGLWLLAGQYAGQHSFALDKRAPSGRPRPTEWPSH
jgi:uncharacterized repeat protein (TIGR01451 family)